MRLKKVSVIISAHNRRNYLKDAIMSVINQTFNPDFYEIIVVKNFTDNEIDNLCSGHKIKNILFTGRPLGQKMARGIDEATGEIIALLDDDDLFESNKLEVITAKLSDGIELYHNDILYIKEYGSTLNNNEVDRYSYIVDSSNFYGKIKKIRNKKGDWYMSCFSMSRRLAMDLKPLYETMEASFDKITFYYALSRGYRILIDSDRLTLYRLHPSLTTITNGIQRYFGSKSLFFRSSSNSIGSLLPYCTDPKIKDLLYYIYMHEYIIYLFMLDGRIFPIKIVIKFIRLWIRYGILSDLIWLNLLILKLAMPEKAHKLHYAHMLNYYDTGHLM